MKLDAEGRVGLMGKVGLSGGTGYYIEGVAWGGAKRDLGKSFPPGWEIIGSSQNTSSSGTVMYAA